MRAFRNVRAEMREAIAAINNPNPTRTSERMQLEREGENPPAVPPWAERCFAELTRAAVTEAPFALIPCRVNGKPSATIALVREDGERLAVHPLFVIATPEMKVGPHED